MTRRQYAIYVVYIGFSLLWLAIFAGWWFMPSHIPNNFHGWGRLADILLFIIVSYVVWHPLFMNILTWAIASHIKRRHTPQPQAGLRVAFVTTFVPQSESHELLYKCLPAMKNVQYPHDTWLLDEGNDPKAKEICTQLGVRHYSRAGKDHYNTAGGKFARKTKGGNHNSWYDSYGNDYDVVAQMDTDFVPESSFLVKTLGYFTDPRIAFVGTPQIYGNTDSLIARGAAEQTYSFYGPILRGSSGMNDSTLLIGANHVMRVSALKDVNHYSAHITEDLLTGMKLHSKGWKSVYVPEALAIGEGPTTWKAYFDQQMRWSFGCIDILFRHSPRLFRGMGLRRAIYYYLLQQHYFTGLATMLSVMLLGLYFFAGITTANIGLLAFLKLYIPSLLIVEFISLYLQRFNILPKKERGLLLFSRIINISAWPIFFLAFLGAVKGKKLTYKVTPKGRSAKDPSAFGLFAPHFLIIAICLLYALASIVFHREALLMIFWLYATILLLLSVPVSIPIYNGWSKLTKLTKKVATAIYSHTKFYELNRGDRGILPSVVTEQEKYIYAFRSYNFLLIFSLISFTLSTASLLKFSLSSAYLWPVLVIWIITLIYFLVSFVVNIGTKDFDIFVHKKLVKSWNPINRLTMHNDLIDGVKPRVYPTVDVFLPTAGEPIEVLRNTWEGVQGMAKNYPGNVEVYCLDDSAREVVRELATEFKFQYIVRPNLGYYKKAGNLRHGFSVSKGEFIVIFDADFRPRHDFLNELLPYFYQEPKVGIVQSPQYFDVSDNQNWLERGAGAVQELFYRYAQVSRETHGASICVGSNAIYRRTALNDTGGTALIEHSEDVHTGFNLRMHGWKLRYVPVVLAKGLCPSTMIAFFKQQYRWCMGSMSLLSSKKFWHTKLSFKARLSYISGFLYYINTGLSSFVVPVIPLIILIYYPSQISIINYLLILPSFVFMYVIFPLWHKSTYGVEAWAVRTVYGWAHFFAVIDSIGGKRMEWNSTGSKMKKDYRYVTFRVMQTIFNFAPAMVWVGLAVARMASSSNPYDYILILFSGLYYLVVTIKVTFFFQNTPSQLVRPLFSTKPITS